MGNNVCCEEEAKGGGFGENKSKFQPNKIQIEPNKFNNNINFNQSPKQIKLAHEQPKHTHKEEPIFLHKEVDKSKSESEIKSHSEDLPRIKTPQLQSNQKVVGDSNYHHLKENEEISQSEEKEQIFLKSVKSQEPVQSKQAYIENQEIDLGPAILIPELNDAVKQALQQQKFFASQFESQPDYRRYDEDFYQGKLDDSGKYPNGLGKFYKSDHSLYIGNFVMGKAQGKGAFIFPDGSYYFGDFKNNCADGSQGIFKSSSLEYEGEFKKNKFHGKGKEKGKTHHYEGEYYDGNKTYGNLKWKVGEQQYEYFGSFDNNLFSGEGTLSEPTGTYKGQFIKGRKHGHGTYNFTNGLRYEGEYREGDRSGRGTLFNPNNKIAYEGEFYKGLPHGSGIIIDKNGKKQSTKWIEGIDQDLL